MNSLDTWFKGDVSFRLNSIECVAKHYPESQFKEGYFACLDAVRESFGLQTTLVIPQEQNDVPLLQWEPVIIVEP